ncbi:DUF6086 family protein [Streptomyces sp. NPDC001315]|uniref:DUF6086 family protein n=1 Tax=Streptomyces sp. NPDC001315 TaxID=3364562 RepID=UPI003686E023
MAVMSYLFEIEGADVWSPSHRAGKLFVGMVTAAADMAKLPNGLGPNLGEMYEIDRQEFQNLVQELLTIRANSDHRYLVMMLDGVLPIMIAMIERVGYPVRPNTEAEAGYLSWVREQELPMNKIR